MKKHIGLLVTAFTFIIFLGSTFVVRAQINPSHVKDVGFLYPWSANVFPQGTLLSAKITLECNSPDIVVNILNNSGQVMVDTTNYSCGDVIPYKPLRDADNKLLSDSKYYGTLVGPVANFFRGYRGYDMAVLSLRATNNSLNTQTFTLKSINIERICTVWDHAHTDKCQSFSNKTDYNRSNVVSIPARGSTIPPVVVVIPPTNDTKDPTVPSDVTSEVVSQSSVEVSWSASEDNVGVVGYYVYRNGTKVSTVTDGVVFTDTGLNISTQYIYKVAAYDAKGNVSARSDASTITIPRIVDTEDPTIPTNVMVKSEASNKVTVSWTSSTDNTRVSGYYVYRNGTKIATVSTNVLLYTNASLRNADIYTVAAFDSNNNVSAPSVGASVVVTPSTVAPASVSAMIIGASYNRVGSGFRRMTGIGNQNPIDWHFTVQINNQGNRNISSIDMWHNEVPQERWSTSNRRLYPIYVVGTSYYNRAYGDIIPATAGPKLELYIQPESTVFNGGIIQVTFTDGSMATSSIPRSAVNLIIPPTTTDACHVFDVNLTSFTATPATSTIGTEVTYMQKWLISQGFHIPGVETGSVSYGYYGAQTVAAVRDFQRSVGISNGEGNYWGPTTQAKANALCNNTPTIIPPVVVVPPVVVPPVIVPPVVVIPPVVVVPPSNTQPTVVKVTYPSGGESFTSGQQIQVRWNVVSQALGITSSSRVRISLNIGGQNLIDLDNLSNDGSENITIPASVFTDSGYTITLSAYGTKGGLSDVSKTFSITSPVVKPVSTYTISSYLSDTNEDWVTSSTFTSGNGRGGTKNDWSWYAKISGTNLDSTGKTIKSITVYANSSNEGWSTSASTDLELNTHNMPLRVFNIYSGQYMSGYDVDLGLKISTAQNPIEFVAYGQMENRSFSGGRIVVKFTDGSFVTSTIPAYTGAVLSTQQTTLTASIWDAIKQYCLENPKDKYCALGL